MARGCRLCEWGQTECCKILSFHFGGVKLVGYATSVMYHHHHHHHQFCKPNKHSAKRKHSKHQSSLVQCHSPSVFSKYHRKAFVTLSSYLLLGLPSRRFRKIMPNKSRICSLFCPTCAVRSLWHFLILRTPRDF